MLRVILLIMVIHLASLAWMNNSFRDRVENPEERLRVVQESPPGGRTGRIQKGRQKLSEQRDYLKKELQTIEENNELYLEADI